MAFPRTSRVEEGKSCGVKGYDVWCWGRFRKNDCVPVIHVLSSFREELPQKTATSAPSFLSRVEDGLVHCAEKGVPKRWIVARVFRRHTKLRKHNRHPKIFLCILNVGFHPWLGKLEMQIRDWFWNPSWMNLNSFVTSWILWKKIYRKGLTKTSYYFQKLPRVCIDVNRSEINTQNLVVPYEISSNLLSICVWIELNSARWWGTIKSFQSNLHQVLWIESLDINSHFLYPILQDRTLLQLQENDTFQ